MKKVNLQEKAELLPGYWQAGTIGQLNNHNIHLLKIKGEFVWHHHEKEDQFFYVVQGNVTMFFREKNNEKKLELKAGDMVVIPKGIDHKPVTTNEALILSIEPDTFINTGNVYDEKFTGTAIDI